jgi:hypothetical protein
MAPRSAEIRSRLLSQLAIPVVVALAVTAVVLFRSSGPFRPRPPVATSPVPPSIPFDPSPRAKPPVDPERTKPAYEGPLGEFIVGIHQGSSALPCPQPLRPTKNEKIKASELYSPVFGKNLEGFVAECADGKITVIVIYGREVIGRGYFIGKPILPLEAPLDGLKLLTAAGKPGLASLPMPGFSWSLRLAFIERFPRGNQPGILVSIDNTDKSLEEATELAAQIMAVKP